VRDGQNKRGKRAIDLPYLRAEPLMHNHERYVTHIRPPVFLALPSSVGGIVSTEHRRKDIRSKGRESPARSGCDLLLLCPCPEVISASDAILRDVIMGKRKCTLLREDAVCEQVLVPSANSRDLRVKGD